MKNILKWHKGRIDWFKRKTRISDYGLLWYTFFKGVLIGIIIMLLSGCTGTQTKPTLGGVGKALNCMFQPDDEWCIKERERQKGEDEWK